MAKPKAKTEQQLEVKPRELPSGQFLSEEQASILTDLIRMYVGSAMPFPTASSGVYLNQDRVLQQQAYLNFAGYDLYDQVELDPQVSAVLQTRKLAVAGLEWRIRPATDDDVRDAEVARTVEDKLRAVPGFFQDMVELMDAVGKGFSVSEIVWAIDSDGFVVPDELLNRQQRRFQFDAKSRWPKIRTLDNPFYGSPVAPQKFIVHRNSQKYESPFGDALDQRLYWMWLFKRTVIKFWMNHAQSTSAPVPIVTVPPNPSPKMKTEALAIAEGIRSASYGYMPSNMGLMWAESKNVANTSDTYEKFIRYANEEIAKCVLGQTLTTEGSGPNGSGSKALGAVHNSVRSEIVTYDAKALAATLTSSLVRWFCELNFFDLKRYPSFEFVLEDSRDLASEAKAIGTLRAAGYKVKREYIENVLQLPLEDEVEEPQEPKPQGENDEDRQDADSDSDADAGE